MLKVTKLLERRFKTGGEQTLDVQNWIPKMFKQRTILHTAALAKYLRTVDIVAHMALHEYHIQAK
jgi:hypothetical protein